MAELYLPSVSVVIVNYNYQNYLERAFASVAAQTYPHIEIIIVDDKSTDNSCSVIDTICEKNANVLAVKLAQNGGQSVASLRGFLASKGAYVLFLDADDELLSECVEAHIYAHLSSRIPVAFTTVDILNNVRGEDVNFSHPGFSDYVTSGKGLKPSALRRINAVAPNSWFGERPPALDIEQIHFVLPPYVEPWVWSPASANCYRRDAVAVLLREPAVERIRWGTDAYLIRPLSALFGSILIDRPLMRYVIHATNRFVKCAPLHNYQIFDEGSTVDDMRNMARTAVNMLMSGVGQGILRHPHPTVFFDTMKALSDIWPGPAAGEEPGDFYLKQLFSNKPSLETGFGEKAYAEEVERHNLKKKSIMQIMTGKTKTSTSS